MLKIAMLGKMGVGKDVAGNYIKMLLGDSNIKIIKFADPIYDIMYMTQDYLGLEREKDRRFLQLVGTDWGRRKDSLLWIKYMEKRVEELEKEGVDGIIVTDVRFFNEYIRLKKSGFKVIKIIRKLTDDELINREGCGSRLHESEADIDIPMIKPDFIIINNDNLEKFYDNIKDIVLSL